MSFPKEMLDQMRPMGDQCGHVECGKPASHHPHLLLKAKGYDKPHQPADVHMGLPVCDEHMAQTTVADLVSDEGWATLEDAFLSTGRYPPDRDTVEIAWHDNETEELVPSSPA